MTLFFFFKQKTAYEMRISDWSLDVCSSDLFYSVAITNNRQQADTGTKMIHIGKNTRSRIVSKGIAAGRSDNTYRGLVRIQPGEIGRASCRERVCQYV